MSTVATVFIAGAVAAAGVVIFVAIASVIPVCVVFTLVPVTVILFRPFVLFMAARTRAFLVVRLLDALSPTGFAGRRLFTITRLGPQTSAFWVRSSFAATFLLVNVLLATAALFIIVFIGI